MCEVAVGQNVGKLGQKCLTCLDGRTSQTRYTEMRYTEYLLYRSNRLSPFFSIFKFDRYNEF